MNIQTIFRAASASLVIVALSGCNATQTAGTDSSSNSGNTSANLLDPVQTEANGVLTQLATQFAGTPLATFTGCLSPTVNQLLDGPDGLLTTVINGLQTGLTTQNPAVLQPALTSGVSDLTAGLQTLTTNLPAALAALNGGAACAPYTGESSSTAPSPSTPTLTPAELTGVLSQITAQINAQCPTEAAAACDQLKNIVAQIGTSATSFSNAISDIQGGGDPVAILQQLATTITGGAGSGSLPLPTDPSALPIPEGGLLGAISANDPTGQLSGGLTQLTNALSPITSAIPANPLTSLLGL